MQDAALSWISFNLPIENDRSPRTEDTNKAVMPNKKQEDKKDNKITTAPIIKPTDDKIKKPAKKDKPKTNPVNDY